MPTIPTALKQQVETRADGCCEYCQSQNRFSPDPFSIEHIVPSSKDGSSQLNNLAYACQGCNNCKYNHTEAIDPLTGKTVPFFTHGSSTGQSILPGQKIIPRLLALRPPVVPPSSAYV